ncbi:MAG TPA: ParB/RepB/Spo0J family partition protein [Anaerolineales bacterium]|nr:ParB/RepB/Spo0J family partition protein [Anaerolineales bacterium]
MPPRSGLGKGLDALIPTGKTSSGEGNGITQVAIDLIQRNPRQPREKFDIEELENLAASIREHGVIQPLIVSPGKNGIYILIAGERRLQASRKAGLQTVPVVIRHATDQQLLELALIENLQRADLNAIEEAEAYHHLEKEFKLSHETIAARVGKNRSTIANTIRLLEASAAVKQALVNGQITAGHARAMLTLPAKAQEEVLNTIFKLDLSVRQTEGLVKRFSGQKPGSKKKVGRSPNISDIERRLQSSLQTRVALKHLKKGGGTVTIYYYSDEDLDTLLEKLT